MNLYEIPEGPMEEEEVTILLQNETTRIERIVSKGHTSGWYDQEEDEWITLLKGEAELAFEDRTVVLAPGDTLLIPRHRRHFVAKTTECIWLCVFTKEETSAALDIIGEKA